MVKKEISSVQNWKEAFWETVLCSVNSSHRVTSFTSRSLSLRLFLWNWQRDIWKPIEAYGEKENILRWKLERSFLRNCFVMCDFHSLSYSCISWSCLLALFLWNLRTDISDPFEEYKAKGNILRWKGERNFLRNFFVICEFISQSYIFPFKKPFAKAVLVELAKGCLEAHRGLWWKRKYLPFKTGKKLSEKLLCVLLIHLTELHLSLQKPLAKTVHVEFAKWYLKSHRGLWWKRK